MPVSSDDPRPDGENSFRPFRAWTSAYEPPPPSIWSRIAGFFSRKSKERDEPAEETDAPNRLLADAAAIGESAFEPLADVHVDDVQPAASLDDFASPTFPPLAADDWEREEEQLLDPARVEEPREFEATPFAYRPLDEPAVESDLHLESLDDSQIDEPLAASDLAEAPALDAPIDELPVASDLDAPAMEDDGSGEPNEDAETTGPELEYLDVDAKVESQPVAETQEDLEPLAGLEPQAELEPPMELEPAAETKADVAARRPGFFSRMFSRRKSVELEEEIVKAEPIELEVVESAPDEAKDEPAEILADAHAFDSFEAPFVEPEIPSFLTERAPERQPELDAEPESVAEPEPPESVAEPEPEQFSIVESRSTMPIDRPALDDPAFFIPEEPTAESAADELEQPTLDDALPTAFAGETPYVEEVTQPWPDPNDAGEPVVDKEPGFFSRLFGRKSKPVEQPEEIEELEVVGEHDPEIVAQVEEAFASTDDFFAADAAPVAGPDESARTFESVDEALPVVESGPPPHDVLFGDTVNPGDILPAFDSPTMEEINSRPTIETSAARATVPAAAMDDESTDELLQPVPPEVDAAAEAERPPFFVPKFRSFYSEIVLYKHQKSQFTSGFATAIVDYTSDLTPDHAAQSLSKRLQEILELQHAEAMWMGGEAAARYPDAQYAMAVLADELFTHMEWPGQEAWPRYLLEPRFFRTHAAEVEFFKRVDTLLKNEAKNPSRAARDLARMYLLVLASGFRGKYRLPNLHRPIADYRRRLYEFVYGNDPLMLYAGDRRIFPEATERTLESRAVARFSGLQQWAAALIVILVGYTLLANFAWDRVSADLTDVTARVEAANRTNASDGSWGSGSNKPDARGTASVVEDSSR